MLGEKYWHNVLFKSGNKNIAYFDFCPFWFIVDIKINWLRLPGAGKLQSTITGTLKTSPAIITDSLLTGLASLHVGICTNWLWPRADSGPDKPTAGPLGLPWKREDAFGSNVLLWSTYRARFNYHTYIEFRSYIKTMVKFLKLWINLLQFTFLMALTATVLIWFLPRQCKKKLKFSETQFFFKLSSPLCQNSMKEWMSLSPDVSLVCTYDYIMRC